MTRPDLVERNRSHRTSFLYESAEWMHDAYVIRRLTLREIAAEVDCALRTVARWMLIHGIETRSSWARPTGEHHHAWKGGPRPCPSCGGPMSHGCETCATCRDRSGSANPNWRGDDVEYAGIHGRLTAIRGKVTEHWCACGAQAEEWSYDHTDPDELRNRASRDDGPFSLDLARYTPMCVPCHRQLDLGR